ncbi:hypothetical protein L208DRAFT_1408675 [Tricholoma matsutake]|nr:hypothetical protein L208DRAFT_1408675 [Tricholoma matsutake 945]
MKYAHVLLACAGAAIVAAAPLVNNEDASLLMRSDSFGSSSVRRGLDDDDTLVLREHSLANDGDALLHARSLDAIDLLVRAFDEQLAARSVEHADEIAQRDLAGLERRWKWAVNKWNSLRGKKGQLAAGNSPGPLPSSAGQELE